MLDALPPEVQRNAQYLKEAGVWHLISENPEVRSCREAADKRWRLGDRGIPLCDEMKSSAGWISLREGNRYVVLHCRGHERIDEAKVEAELGGTFRRLVEDELLSEFGMGYGSVTPFGFADRPDVLQVFDGTIFQPYFPPFTMMTNLGALTVGVEFEPEALRRVLPNTSVADIVADGDGVPPVQHTLGILTGNGPESGALLWEIINDEVREKGGRQFRGDVAFPPVVIESVPGMGLSMELNIREREVRPVVIGGVERLCQRGATIIGIACNTTPYFGPEVREVCERYGATYVSLPDETAAWLRAAEIDRFDFFGISAVTDFGGLSAFSGLEQEFDLVRPDQGAVRRINAVAYKVKERGVDGPGVNGLRDLVNKASSTDTIVIALTELSVVLHEQKQSGKKRLVDTLTILGKRMAALYLEERAKVAGARSGAGVAED